MSLFVLRLGKFATFTHYRRYGLISCNAHLTKGWLASYMNIALDIVHIDFSWASDSLPHPSQYIIIILILHISSKLSIDFIFSPFILDHCMSYEFWFVRPHVCSLRPFFLDNRSKKFSDFAYGYGALWVGWSDRTLFQGKIQIWPIMAENGQKQPKIILF